MRIVSHRKLKEFYETKGYEDSRIALERWYDIHVVFADSVAGKLRFSGRLKRYEDIDNLLTMIKLTNDVDFEIAERVIIVRTNKNRK